MSDIYKEELERLLKAWNEHGGSWRPDHEQAWFDAISRAEMVLKNPIEQKNKVKTCTLF